MRRAIAVAVFFYVSISSVRPTPYEIDIQADYLNSLLNAAKLRPMMDGEVNFSPNKDKFSNVVQSVAGKRGMTMVSLIPYVPYSLFAIQFQRMEIWCFK